MGAITVNSILNGSVFYIHESPGGLEATCLLVNLHSAEHSY